MKKIIALAAVASLLALASCASNGTSPEGSNASAAQTKAASSHHDYKGERFK